MFNSGGLQAPGGELFCANILYSNSSKHHYIHGLFDHSVRLDFCFWLMGIDGFCDQSTDLSVLSSTLWGLFCLQGTWSESGQQWGGMDQLFVQLSWFGSGNT